MKIITTRDKRLLISTGTAHFYIGFLFTECFTVSNNYYRKKTREKEENEQQEREKAASGTVWERISREIDFKSNSSTRDVSRMKQLMTDLRKDSRAPGTIVDA
jgi:hypothetical protein